MKVLLFGATGMVGQGVLRECLLAADVDRVQTVGRAGTGMQNAKLHEVVTSDLFRPGKYEAELRGFDACFFCLGVSSSGMKEDAYTHLTYELTIAVAETLARLNPEMTFVYVSGAGTDSSEQGRSMWARVKGRTENALLRLFPHAYMFRPGLIVPLHGIRSKTKVYQFFYALTGPLLPLLRRAFPKQVVTTEELGHAMLAVARTGAPKRVLETGDIRALLDFAGRSR
ncbi:NAD-dependent epimerase/dehydratase family protein [Acidicapsa ligni]|uniref:NAD-dependent epimerase/dehydratase family protein n=1 Tax=Acidicapsa ligni TaxID=542300 RepID=UPI0021DF6DAE|nr:NAD-dependent epimerase/dehydratase family protein [Acidicapsa ligni]